MSSKSENNKYEEVTIQDETPLKLKSAVIPFSMFSKDEKFIYYGHEKIPFHKRHPIYQIILRNEFTDCMQKN